jgi:hypothetical protein
MVGVDPAAGGRVHALRSTQLPRWMWGPAVSRALLGWSSCLALSGRRTFYLLLGSHVEEHLEVLTELLFLQGHRLRAGPEEHGRCSEVLGGPFGNRSPMDIANDAAT